MSGIHKFISDHLYNVRRILSVRLENLKDDLRSDDPVAIAEAREIMDWLFPPPEPLSEEQKLQRVMEVLNDSNLSLEERLMKVQQAGRSTGRRRGRPRSETSSHAIDALSMHYGTQLSWREIALKVKGCKHKRPNPERSCIHCGEAIRDAAGRLEKALTNLGFDPVFPRGNGPSQIFQ